MGARRVVLQIVALTCMLSAPAFAEGDWVDIKDPNELRALYSNKTFRGKGWIGHYRADGKGILIVKSESKSQSRTWEVRGDDSVCVAAGGAPAACYRFQRNSKQPNEWVAISLLSESRLPFTVEDGIPNF